jgi:hypothetical protein
LADGIPRRGDTGAPWCADVDESCGSARSSRTVGAYPPECRRILRVGNTTHLGDMGQAEPGRRGCTRAGPCGVTLPRSRACAGVTRAPRAPVISRAPTRCAGWWLSWASPGGHRLPPAPPVPGISASVTLACSRGQAASLERANAPHLVGDRVVRPDIGLSRVGEAD